MNLKMINFYMKRELLNWLHFKPLLYFVYLLSILTIYYFIYTDNLIYLFISILLLYYFFILQTKNKKWFLSYWIFVVILLTLIYYYWNSNEYIDGEELNDIGKVIKSKTNYIIVKVNNTKFYIQNRNHNFIVGLKVKISGKVNYLTSNVNYYQFDFKEYLAQDFIKYEINPTFLEKSDGFNLRVVIYKILNLETAPELVKILFLNNYESTDFIIKGLNNLGLKFLINFNLFNLFLIIQFLERKLKFKLKVIFISWLFVWNYLTIWPMIMTRVMIKQFFSLFKRIKGNNELKNLLTMTLLMILFPSFILKVSFWYINLIIFLNSFLRFKKSKILKFIYFYILINILNIYFTYQLSFTSSLYALLLFPIISIYYLITPVIYLLNKNYLISLYSVLWLIVSFFETYSLVFNLGVQNLLFLVFGFMMSISIAQNAISIKLKIISVLILAFVIFITWLIKPSEYLTMLNVGNGNSFVYHNKWNNITIIFDAGVGKQRSTELISDFLKYQGINKIDLIFISHNHEDHYNNLFAIKENFKVKEIVFNNKFSEVIKLKNIIINVFINPYGNSENNKSLVLIVDINNIRSVFMGDAEKQTETYLLNRLDFLYILVWKKSIFYKLDTMEAK